LPKREKSGLFEKINLLLTNQSEVTFSSYIANWKYFFEDYNSTKFVNTKEIAYKKSLDSDLNKSLKIYLTWLCFLSL